MVDIESKNIDWVSNYAYVDPDDSLVSLYIVSLYWSTATLSTLGYGDVIPTTDLERVFVVVATILGGSMYAYIVGNVCGIAASMDEKSAHWYQVRSIDGTSPSARPAPLTLHPTPD